MRKLILAMTVIAMATSGCANMSKEQQAAFGTGLGALAGAGLGAAIGGKQGAAIGAGVGALAGGLAAYALARNKMVVNNRLSPMVKQQLAIAKQEAEKNEGLVEVRFPPNTPPLVVQDILSTGVSVAQDDSLKDDYVILLARSRNDLSTIRT